MRDVSIGEDLHLLLGGAHEEKPRSEEEERGEELEAIGVCAVRRERVSISEHEGDLDDPRQPRSHERVAEDGVDHGRNGQMLRVCRHTPAC